MTCYLSLKQIIAFVALQKLSENSWIQRFTHHSDVFPFPSSSHVHLKLIIPMTKQIGCIYFAQRCWCRTDVLNSILSNLCNRKKKLYYCENSLKFEAWHVTCNFFVSSHNPPLAFRKRPTCFTVGLYRICTRAVMLLRGPGVDRCVCILATQSATLAGLLCH